MRFDIWKVLILLVWGLVIANELITLPGPWPTLLRATGAVMVVAHLGEYAIFYRRIRNRPESASVQFIMTALFGVFYWKDFPSGLRSAPRVEADR